MILGIDASNIRGGGGITHLSALLRNAQPERFGFERVIIWGGRNTLESLDGKPWLKIVHEPWLDKNILYRSFWQKFILPRRIRNSGASVVFFPGGLIRIAKGPWITMSQNLLPFEPGEIKRYPMGLGRLRLMLLRGQQLAAFRKSRGTIFLSNYARDVVTALMPDFRIRSKIIPHGLERRFFASAARPQRDYNRTTAIKLCYVSFIGEYKHQWNLIRAVRQLRLKGWALELDLVGNPVDPGAIAKVRQAMSEDPGATDYVRIISDVRHRDIHEVYQSADVFVFLSSCETFGQILIEGMAAGVPVLCSRLSSLPEIGQSAVAYTDPLSVGAIASDLEKLLLDKDLRVELSKAAIARAAEFSWETTANLTFEFFQSISGDEYER